MGAAMSEAIVNIRARLHETGLAGRNGAAGLITAARGRSTMRGLPVVRRQQDENKHG